MRKTVTVLVAVSAATLALTLGACAAPPLDAAACTAFVTAQNAYTDVANKSLTENTPVNSALWTAAWKALLPAVDASAKLATTDKLKTAFTGYETVLKATTNASEAERQQVWQTGYAQVVFQECVNLHAAKDGELTPLN